MRMALPCCAMKMSASCCATRVCTKGAMPPAHNDVTGTFAAWWLRILLNRVGDDHARLRRLANPAFLPKLIIALQPKFTELPNDIVDRFARSGRCDFMAEFSEPYVTRVVCLLLN